MGEIHQEPFQFFLGTGHSLYYEMNKNMHSLVNKRMRLALSFAHVLAIIIGKTDIAINKPD